MRGSRSAWLAGVAVSTLVIGCGSASTAPTRSSSGATQAPSQTPAALTAQIVLTGGINGTLALNAAESNCQRLPTGVLSATFDGVLPGTEAGFTVLEPAGTTTLASGDAVSLNTNNDFWHTDTNVKVVITMTTNAASGMVTGVMGGQTGSGVDNAVAPVNVSASFSCPLT
jgi:hypothetical protein